MVDSNDRERITEAQEELQKMVHVMTTIDDCVQLINYLNTLSIAARRRVKGGNAVSIREQARPAQCNDGLRAY